MSWLPDQCCRRPRRLAQGDSIRRSCTQLTAGSSANMRLAVNPALLSAGLEDAASSTQLDLQPALPLARTAAASRSPRAYNWLLAHILLECATISLTPAVAREAKRVNGN